MCPSHSSFIHLVTRGIQVFKMVTWPEPKAKTRVTILHDKRHKLFAEDVSLQFSLVGSYEMILQGRANAAEGKLAAVQP